MSENESIISLKWGEGMNIIANREFSVSVENITLRLLVDRKSNLSQGEGEPFELHRHVSAELFACISGRFELATEDGRLTLNEGDLAIVPPGVPHCKLPEADGAALAVLSFTCDRRSERSSCDLYSALSTFVCSEGISVYRERNDICAEAEDIFRQGQTDGRIMPALKMAELLIKIAEADSETPAVGREGSVEGRYDIQRMMRLDALIASSYMKELTLKDIADSLYISSRQLDRIVRRRYGKTLHKVIMETRVRAAAHMLLTTDKAVDKIGREVGFSSNAGFYREFSRYCGSTPAEFRKKGQLEKILL
ncbi:MAG: AraC family transcriptional regulator [Ruminococcaceae bacterium]|nr:AraC family transcriptional regulator [Oscillospiraceae bacterium]